MSARGLDHIRAVLPFDARSHIQENETKVPIKVVFPLVFAILPVLFIVLLFPAITQIVSAFP